MKKGLGAVAVLALATSSAMAGTVSFIGPTDILPGTASAQYQVSVGSSVFTSFQAISLIVGSVDGLGMTFEYDPAFEASTTSPPAPAAEFGLYGSLNPASKDLAFGGVRTANPEWTAPILVGTLTVDTSALADGATVTFGVDADFETLNFGSAFSVVQDAATNQDPLNGLVTLRVVPEPATMLLLGIGGLVAMRRRLA